MDNVDIQITYTMLHWVVITAYFIMELVALNLEPFDCFKSSSRSVARGCHTLVPWHLCANEALINQIRSDVSAQR